MRFRHPDGTLVHLAYCTDVHPAEDLDGVITQLQVHASASACRASASASGSAEGSSPGWSRTLTTCGG